MPWKITILSLALLAVSAHADIAGNTTGQNFYGTAPAASARRLMGSNLQGDWTEAFIDFAQDHRSAIAIARTNRKVIVLRSLTKIFALPGLRVGCVAGHPETIEKLRDAIEPWSVNAVADRVGRACLEVADAFIRETRRFVTVEMARLANELARLPGIRVFPSAANFMMMEIEEEPSPGAFGKRMIEQGIRIRDLRGLPGCRPGLYRIGIRSQADNDRFLKAAGAR